MATTSPSKSKSSGKKFKVPKLQNSPIEARKSNGLRHDESTSEFIQKAALLLPDERNQLLTSSEKAKAYRLKQEVEEQVRANLGKTSKLALDNLIKLAFSAESEHVRARCTIDLLDRAGFKPVEKVQHLKAPRSPEEVEAELVSIIGKENADMILGKRKIVN
jgi:hypothetical protein